MDEERIAEIKGRYSPDINSFVTVDYTTPEGAQTAKGILKDITSEGRLLIVHKYKPKRWEIDPSAIVTYSVSSTNGGGH